MLRLETMMRATSLSLAAALTLLCVTPALHGQAVDPAISPGSVQLLDEARAARAAGNLDTAVDLSEAALADDPRNRGAITTLADIAASRGLSGKAIRYYREALLLDPTDTAALRGQGEALVAKGAVRQAEVNLGKIKTLCNSGCADATMLAAAIAKGPPVATAQVDRPASPAKN